MLDITQYIVLAAVIVGVTELINRIRASDWWVVVTIVTSVLVGAIFGAIHYYPGVDIVTGIALGFGASGTLKALSVFGNKSTPAPSEALERK